MNEMLRVRSAAAVAAVTVLFLSACASGPKVDVKEPRHVVGSEADVKVNAQIFAERVGSNESVAVAWEVENGRPEAIAFADLTPHTSYDVDSRTVTIELGSEVPGNELVPRLQKVASGEKRAFRVAARMPVFQMTSNTLAPVPRYLRVRLYFLGETAPFESLIGIPERAIKDRKLADELFPRWVEKTESLVTNAVPIVWAAPATMQEPAAVGRRRRG